MAEELGFTEAGLKLKEARESTRLMIKTGRAATCDYVENNRREIAIRFVIDAFNGKVDSILSRTKTDIRGQSLPIPDMGSWFRTLFLGSPMMDWNDQP